MTLLVAALILGLIVGRFFPPSPQVARFSGHVNSAALILLLFTMGIRIGADPATMENIPRLGTRALILAVGAVAGSIGAVNAGSALYRKLRREGGRA